MWELYTSGIDSVAISTTVAKLIHAMDPVEHYVIIGSVEYTDHSQLTSPNSGGMTIFQPLFQKRKSYAHECELRAAVILKNWDRDRNGISVEIDLKNIIERIVVSPRYPTWALSSLQKAIKTAELDLTIESSDLLKAPESLDATPDV